ncbi:Cytochrome bo(3) ubiquinol oxidase subunit 3 [Buchnera aphidicola (Tetraneura ulmi)]|uniref:cytochrome c oxidase subunit 3 n=1 Tax=Buchnera aphidicola TaxID=9 RepID=UPI00346451D6
MTIINDKKYSDISCNKNNNLDKKILGMWLYLVSDAIFFSVLFAVYAVMFHNNNINFFKQELFNLNLIVLETLILLFSSITCVLTTIYFDLSKKKSTFFYLILTLFLGVTFISIEIFEFLECSSKGFLPQKNGFLSIFFTIISLHGLHVCFGVIWMFCLLFQIIKMGFTPLVYSRIKCFSLFWHFLDLIWIFVFTFIYLIGVIL